MATKKLMCVLFGVLVITAWVLGSTIEARAETMNYKIYVWMNKRDVVSVDDVEGHIVTLAQRGGFYVLENGEIATIKRVSMNDIIKNLGSAVAYETITFADGSTIVLKRQSTLRGAEGQVTSSESSRVHADLKESRVLKAIRQSFFQPKKRKLAQNYMVKGLSPTPYLPSDF
jgi:nucleoside-diphosphate-sugar epimerase